MVLLAERPIGVRLAEYEPIGAAREIFTRRDGELLLAGPAGTGKTRANLEKLYACALKYDGMRGLVLRKTRKAITQSAQVTFERRVVPDGAALTLRSQEQEYRLPNGSIIALAGLDQPSKIMSSEWDMSLICEATELDEADLEAVTSRLRNGAMPYQQVLLDCNPDAPSHWLKKRCDRGQTALLESVHEDNPVLWDRRAQAWTLAGRQYIEKLDALTGVRLQRLRFGRWAAAEGLIYEGFDRSVHLLNTLDIGEDWPRYLAVDFGYTNPFVCQWWAEDPDGRLYLYREIYRTRTLVEDHARTIVRLSVGEPKPRAIICDHDAEDRATLERHLQMSTTAAKKTVSDGIQAVQARLRVQPDGKPRLFFVRDALVERDGDLEDAKKPASTIEEIDGYVWDTSANRRKGEAPVKRDDHSMDCVRYLVAFHDLAGRVRYAPSLYD